MPTNEGMSSIFGQPALALYCPADGAPRTIPRVRQPSRRAVVAPQNQVIPAKQIEQAILVIRGQKVMLDRDLAALYGVETFNLNKAVKRNLERFPSDFMFQLTKEETAGLTFQTGISNTGRGGRRYLPHVFTEQGVAMLSSVLRSKKAATVNIEIMRAFVRLRDILAAHKELAKKLEELESKCDAQFRVVFDTIKSYIIPPAETKRKPIGFQQAQKKGPERGGH